MGLAEGELAAVLLLQFDPLSPDQASAPAHVEPPLSDGKSLHNGSTNGDLPDRDAGDTELWGRALSAHRPSSRATFLTDGLREHADVVLPAEAYPEKEGTIVHPDGRVQRLRPAVAHPGSTRAQWQVIAELSARIGLDLEVLTGPMASQQLFDAVPYYAGLTLEEIGGKGVRRQP